jgi:hypothetical protein
MDATTNRRAFLERAAALGVAALSAAASWALADRRS